MSAFEFISHENFPEDEYTLEAVVLCFDRKYRVTYVRKKMQNGGKFWDVISGAVKQKGEKKYLKSFSQDSNFLREDIMHFLDSRGWEKGRQAAQVTHFEKGSQIAESSDLPF